MLFGEEEVISPFLSVLRGGGKGHLGVFLLHRLLGGEEGIEGLRGGRERVISLHLRITVRLQCDYSTITVRLLRPRISPLRD